MQINHISQSSLVGGAAIAARRLHLALRADGLESRMTVADGPDEDLVTKVVPKKTLQRFFQREWARHLRKTYAEQQIGGLASLGFVRTGLGDHLNRQTKQILNLHWINFDLLSITEIGALTQPVVWTLHDMWPFSGAEHYSEQHGWRDGYATSGKGFDLNRWVWRRKAAAWKTPMQIVAPSRWIGDCARESRLMRDWPVTVIPNAIDTSVWKPVNKAEARKALNLSAQAPLVLFGAVRGTDDPRKGFVHLLSAMERVHAAIPQVQAIVFGSDGDAAEFPFPVKFMGAVSDQSTLRQIYCAADVFALPSRQDNLPNTGVEAMACGVPVAGFDIGGLPDLVPDPGLGYLARPFDEADLARGICELLRSRDTDVSHRRSENLLAHVSATFGQDVVADQYRALYEKVWEQA